MKLDNLNGSDPKIFGILDWRDVETASDFHNNKKELLCRKNRSKDGTRRNETMQMHMEMEMQASM